MSKFVDLTGQKFGRLTAIERVGRDSCNHALWKCLCDCGNYTTAGSNSLKSGNTKSCGCLNLERATERIVRYNFRHGETGTRLWRIWSGMISRCESPSTAENKYYQGKGIAVCNAWHAYENFKNWALKNGYRDDLTIDRIDLNGNYEPSNCRWATKVEQAENRSSTRLFTVNGETHSLSGWSRCVGLNPNAIGHAIAGKTDEEAQMIVAEYAKRPRVDVPQTDFPEEHWD